jgi:hypothetical protein
MSTTGPIAEGVSMIDLASLPLLKGRKALVTGIANDQSIGLHPVPKTPS